MPLFQKSVINRYLKILDSGKVDEAFNKFQKFYGNKLRLHNIMQLKEENYQEGFLREIFADTLGYTINPNENFNLTTEFKNATDSRKADGAIIKNGKAIGVIELKSTKTKNLESIKEQAFGYKNNQPDCKYVITSNFQKLRFYIDNATDYEEFNLFHLDKKQFKLLYLLLSKDSIFSNLPEKLKQETKFHEDNISARLYADYKQFKDKIFDNLVKNNPQYDKLTLFKKSQKLLDRFLFIFFAEDCGLIPPNAVSKIIEQWKTLQELDEYKPLYSRFQKLFMHLDKGHTYKKWGEIPAYNGGLFRNDEVLDNSGLKINDEVLENDSLKLSKYDFNTEVDVNILGHIFEHSLNEIEEITAELSSLLLPPMGLNPLDKQISKRKKDGIFYTPKYITKYIIENTVGKLCDEKKSELQIENLSIDDTYRKKDKKINAKGKKLFNTLNTYKDWLFSLKILDPACGSGAFLNQALDFLIAEHKQIDDIIAELTGSDLRLFDTDKTILENNIFGVDINEESVEIARLSLWLRTARKGRKLSDLSANIKCGNSLIDDPEIAGDKAFDWHIEFPQVFKEKKLSQVDSSHISGLKPDEKVDYVKLIKQKSKQAKEKSEQASKLYHRAAKLSDEASKITAKIYEYAEKLDVVHEPNAQYNTLADGFDVVIGNPPYVIVFEHDTKKLLEKNYKVFKRNNDLYTAFFDRGIQILKKKGILGFITPNSFIKGNYFKELRSLLAKYQLSEIVDFNNQLIFEDANVYSAITIINKVEAQKEWLLKSNLENKIGVIKPHTIEFIHKNEIQLKVNKYDCFDDYFLVKDVGFNYWSVGRGKVRGNSIGSRVFYSGNKKSHKDILYIKGSGFNRYSKIVCENYLKHNYKEFLNENDIFRFTTEILEVKPKIIYRQTSSFLAGTIDDNGLYTDKTVHSIINRENYNFNLKYVLLLFNSRFLNYLYKLSTAETGRAFAQVKTVNVKKLPFIPISELAQQPFIAKADQMLTLHKNLQEKSEKFIKRIKSNFENLRITKNLENFYNFGFSIFIKELKKQKIKLSLHKQDEWEDYFEKYKTEINQIQTQINQTDREIDTMIYELYELTPQEIEIIEKS